MQHVPAPPLCRADALQRTVTAQGATQGLMVTLSLLAKHACRLPARPKVRLLVGGKRAAVRQVPFRLSTEDVPRRTIGPSAPAVVVLRWENWCGVRGPVALRLTLGGVSTVVSLGAADRAPICVARGHASTLGVSLFVRR